MTARGDRELGRALETRSWALKFDEAAYNVDRRRFSDRLRHPGLHYQRVLRDVEFLYSIGSVRLAEGRRAYLKALGMFLGISVPPFTFKEGLSLPHYGSIVVNDQVRAGRFCRLHSGVNIGETSDGAPQLGTGVYVGPGAVLYGAIRIGDHAVIGANAVVGIDVPANSMAVGVPARVVRTGEAPRVMPAWIERLANPGAESRAVGSSGIDNEASAGRLAT